MVPKIFLWPAGKIFLKVRYRSAENIIHRNNCLFLENKNCAITADSPNRLGHSIMKLFLEIMAHLHDLPSARTCEYLEHHGDE